MILYKNKYLLVEGKFDTPIGKLITHKGVEYTLLPWCLTTYLICKTTGVEGLPNPLCMYDYTKTPYAPYIHQRSTTEFLALNLKCFCWNEAGTGKTASCLWAYDYLREQNVLKKLLIICPLSTTQNVWGNELFKMLTHLDRGILTGSRKKRLELLEQKFDLYVINHDGIKVLTDELIAWQPELVIVDEHTAFKNLRTHRFKALTKIVKQVKGIWMLSGTPAPQAPTDVFAPARLICPEEVGRSFVRFRDLTMYQVGMYRWLPKPNFEILLKECVKPVIRFTRDECLDLPDVVTQTFEVPLSTQQKLAFNKLKKDAILRIGKGEITAVNEGVMRSKLLQCCSGYVYDTEKNVIELNPKARLETLKEIIEESSRGVLVFMSFRSSIAATEKYLRKEFSVRTVTGSTSVKKRTQYFSEFQESKIKVLIAHPQTMAHGVTLTAADTVIWGLVTSNNEWYTQANSRIQRIGQTHKMRVIRLVSTPLEENILMRLEQKRSMQGVLLETLGKKEKVNE